MATLPLPLRPTIAGGRNRMTLKSGQLPGIRPFHVILDFDKTITTNDTIERLAVAASKLHPPDSPAQRHVLTEWKNCVDAYLDDCKSFNDFYRPTKTHRISMESEEAYQRALRGVELESVKRVSQAGIFHIPKTQRRASQWSEEGAYSVAKGFVEIRKGFGDFIAALNRRNDNEMVCDHSVWDVLSVNFSSDFVRGCISHALPQYAHWESVRVLANEITSEGMIIAPQTSILGEERRLLNSDDKLAGMRELLSRGAPTNPLTIYVGDSLTDIECIRAADVGICMFSKDKGSLQEAFVRWGIEVSHISNYRELPADTAELTIVPEKKFYYAYDFAEIAESRLMRPWLPIPSPVTADTVTNDEQQTSKKESIEVKAVVAVRRWGGWSQPSPQDASQQMSIEDMPWYSPWVGIGPTSADDTGEVEGPSRYGQILDSHTQLEVEPMAEFSKYPWVSSTAVTSASYQSREENSNGNRIQENKVEQRPAEEMAPARSRTGAEYSETMANPN